MTNLFSDSIEIGDLATATKLFHESRSGFLTLFNKSPICMSMTTTNLGKRTYVRVNDKFLEKFNFAESEIIGRTSVEVGILDETESLRVGELIREKGRLQNDYVKCRAKDGTTVHAMSSIERMEMDEETYLISFFIDVSKIIEQQAIIEQQMRELRETNHELEAFSYSVSHDLRAPLRAINGYASILEEDFRALFNDEGKRILYNIRNNAKKMGILIDDLLNFSKLGRQDLLKTDINMNVLIREILTDFDNTTEHKAEVRVGDLHPVKGDYALIKQVAINLISNAIKYSSKKENPVVEIISVLENGYAVYTVKDNGEGFDMEYADKLFGVFQRLHRDEEFEGIGIGLAIVERIVTRHGGEIHATSELGESATFRFSLPLNS